MIDIQVNGLVKSFEVGHNVLDGLTFQIDQGERVGLLGKTAPARPRFLRFSPGNWTMTRARSPSPPGGAWA